MVTTGPLAGKVAVVTGASQGIGKAIALELAGAQTSLCLVARRVKALEEVAQAAMRVSATPVHIRALDLTEDDHVRRFAAFVGSELGRCDVLVLCAGAFGRGLVREAPVEQLDHLFRANVRAPYLLIQLLLPQLIADRGQVVFVNSSQGLNAGPMTSQFAATQHALKALADSLRAEENQSGIRVLSVFPGRTATPRIENLYKMEGKPYDPDVLLQSEDVASAIVHALSLPERAEITNLHIRPSVKWY